MNPRLLFPCHARSFSPPPRKGSFSYDDVGRQVLILAFVSPPVMKRTENGYTRHFVAEWRRGKFYLKIRRTRERFCKVSSEYWNTYKILCFFRCYFWQKTEEPSHPGEKYEFASMVNTWPPKRLQTACLSTSVIRRFSTCLLAHYRFIENSEDGLFPNQKMGKGLESKRLYSPERVVK